MDMKCPRKLDFNAPLLSTRRPPGGITTAAATVEMSGTISQTGGGPTRRDASEWVPFSWELAPGMPKNMETSSDHQFNQNDKYPLPPPKLPPSRWHPPPSKEAKNDEFHDHDDGCDGDVDEDDDDREEIDNDVFSDAMDMFSLSESVLDINGDTEKSSSIDNRSPNGPNFIIQRFLPDANALAASSVLTLNKKQLLSHSSNVIKYPEDQDESISRSSRRWYLSPREGCGLETLLFPWRMKHKLCGIKSPVREGSMNWKPHCSSTRKKQNS